MALVRTVVVGILIAEIMIDDVKGTIERVLD